MTGSSAGTTVRRNVDWHVQYEQAREGDWRSSRLPMVEIFETVEGEGTRAGYPTVFVRVFHCNLRCTWCDTPYSYAPAKPEFEASIGEIVDRVDQFGWHQVCLTGGEPLIHRHKSQLLIDAIASLPQIEDLHVETNGAIDVRPFAALREQSPELAAKLRFIVDYKLPSSGEQAQMVHEHLAALSDRDEVKFVIADDHDFDTAVSVLAAYPTKAQVLFSPVWESMPPRELVNRILQHRLSRVKLNLQIHKVIWDPNQRGV
ncbi:7-carboxy-7-deazaguanine synthase [Alicyclobacillus hesperidum subsp. aegles]|uniref:7-carboxy-7-deazaguanine synthase QueE n=1 Tax=Alicyclobacillus hesperidum TaxID=89784 RepID=UPI00222ABB67|nr:radical SAM protein [Alicyclobacillus hesperidum]GLG00258.1 7-carboxy-7-deazaguanine synthase [Alicyclobacillus hesperidum subsp. aegles]